MAVGAASPKDKEKSNVNADPPPPEGSLSAGTPDVTDVPRTLVSRRASRWSSSGPNPESAPHGRQAPSSHGHSGPCPAGVVRLVSGVSPGGRQRPPSELQTRKHRSLSCSRLAATVWAPDELGVGRTTRSPCRTWAGAWGQRSNTHGWGRPSAFRPIPGATSCGLAASLSRVLRLRHRRSLAFLAVSFLLNEPRLRLFQQEARRGDVSPTAAWGWPFCRSWVHAGFPEPSLWEEGPAVPHDGPAGAGSSLFRGFVASA